MLVPARSAVPAMLPASPQGCAQPGNRFRASSLLAGGGGIPL